MDVRVLNVPADTDEAKKRDLEFWKEFDKLAAESVDEELSLADFPRLDFGREPILFDGGELS